MKPICFRTYSAATVALGLTILSSVALANWAPGKHFGNQSVKGAYSFFLNGWITAPSPIPTWSTGVFRADGRGKMVSTEAVFNVGGCVVKVIGAGEYQVNDNGTGSAETALDVNDINNCWQGGASVKFNFEFTINKETLDIVGTSWTNVPGSLIPFGSSGQARPQ